MKQTKFNVVIIEPSEIIIRGVSAVLGESDLFQIVGTFADVVKFLEHPPLRQTADIVIINPTLVSYGKRGAIRALFAEARLVALLYNYVDRDILAQFDESIEVYDKSAKILHKLERTMASGESSRTSTDVGELSDREREILVAVAKGMMNKEIADRYNISIHTVMAHRKNISRKTGIRSVSGFVVYALLNNFIEEYEVQ